MFELYADKTKLTVRGKEPVTSGSVNAYQVRFSFSEDWNGLNKTAVFMAGCASVYVPLDDDGACTIPAETLTQPGRYLMAGVYGKQGEELVLPTTWANLGIILEGVPEGEPSHPPAVPVGTADHRKLTHRDAADQHPMKAITELEETLESLPRPMTAEELQKILNGGIEHEQDT